MIPTLYYFPFTCATAAHIVFEESGLEYQRQLVDLANGDNKQSDYLQLNPKGTVPALQIETGLLTENQAILTYIADLVPNKHLIPTAGSEQRARVHEWMNYCAASLHPYVRMVFRPSAFAGKSVNAQKAVKTQGLSSLETACYLIEQKLTKGEWSVGTQFSVSDAYLFIMYLWTRDIRMQGMPDAPKWHALACKVAQRPSTQKVLNIELLNRPNYIIPDLTV